MIWEKSNRRELAYHTLIGAMVLLIALATAATLWYLTPRPRLVMIGNVKNFPPADDPYYIAQGDAVYLFIVNTGQEFIAFDARSTTTEERCRVKWVPINERFEDPCCGSKFTLDGTYIEGPAVRNLDRYPVTIRGEQVWVNLSQPMLGDSRTVSQSGVETTRSEVDEKQC